MTGEASRDGIGDSDSGPASEAATTYHRFVLRTGAGLRPRIDLALALVGVLMLVACGSTGKAALPAPHTSPSPAPAALNHELGVFNLNTPAQAQAAAAAGVKLDFVYGIPPSVKNPVGVQLGASHMSIVSGDIWALVHRYQCQLERHDHAANVRRYCAGATDPPMTEADLLAKVRYYAEYDAKNPLVSAYWILDDQPPDGRAYGNLRSAEIQVASILHQYSPNRPTICGVGAAITTTPAGYAFHPGLLKDVTPQACDEVAFYVYSEEQVPSKPMPASDYDWSMRALLTQLVASMRSAGLAHEPWMGIGQAWGGFSLADRHRVVTPTPKQMTTQAAAFCHAGASGMTWFGWTLTDYRDLKSPATDPRLTDGITQGGRACQTAWR